MLQSWDKLLLTSTLTELHRVEGDFVQCQTTMRAFASRIELDWNRIVHQNALWILVFSKTLPWNKQIATPDASQLTSQERWQVADLKHLKTSDIFSLPRINTKDFPYIKGKINWSTGINYSSVNLDGPKSFFVASRLIEEVNQFFKNTGDTAGAPNDNFRENICSEDDLRSKIFGIFFVKFLACLPLLGFLNM